MLISQLKLWWWGDKNCTWPTWSLPKHRRRAICLLSSDLCTVKNIVNPWSFQLILMGKQIWKHIFMNLLIGINEGFLLTALWSTSQAPKTIVKWPQKRRHWQRRCREGLPATWSGTTGCTGDKYCFSQRCSSSPKVYFFTKNFQHFSGQEVIIILLLPW